MVVLVGVKTVLVKIDTLAVGSRCRGCMLLRGQVELGILPGMGNSTIKYDV